MRTGTPIRSASLIYVHFEVTVVFTLLCSVVSEATWTTGGHSINKVRLVDLENEVHTTNNPSWEPAMYMYY